MLKFMLVNFDRDPRKRKHLTKVTFCVNFPSSIFPISKTFCAVKEEDNHTKNDPPATRWSPFNSGCGLVVAGFRFWRSWVVSQLFEIRLSTNFESQDFFSGTKSTPGCWIKSFTIVVITHCFLVKHCSNNWERTETSCSPFWAEVIVK